MTATNSITKKNLESKTKEILEKVAKTIRGLSIDAVEKANSGHPGMPLGCAEIAAYLFGVGLKYNPKNPDWPGRDCFILSGGHGSMLLYSCLHLAGYDLSLDELKNFRQLHSKTPGHPEEQDTPGVETTTGPLGQGLGNAVGRALGIKMLGAKFNTDAHKIFDSKVVAIITDGCIMEGATSEVSSLAGHLQIDNLIAIYDSNNVTLDGPKDQSCSENTKMRYQAYGWDVYEVDGHNLDEIHSVFSYVKENQKRPALIIAHTIIGKGSPHKAGTHKVHGSPLGPEEAKETKDNLGIPQEPRFYVPQEVKDFFAEKLKKDVEKEKEWAKKFKAWGDANPEMLDVFRGMEEKTAPADLEKTLKAIDIKNPIGSRSASHVVIQTLGGLLPFLYGGSADLSSSDMTMIEKYPLISPGDFEGRNIKFGIREFGMALMATGLSHTGMIVPFIGTFLTFSDYMRNAIRLCSMMKSHVIYHFTHDSIFLGEDGPTHQPIEQLASLRAIPNLHVIRPADSNEVKMAWIAALKYKGPTAFSLSRQNLPQLPETDVPYKDGMARGAYIIKKERSKPDFTLIATGSEVSLALDAAKELEKKGKDVRVISMPCFELYEAQNKEYKQSVLGGDIGTRVSIEAASTFGWHKYIGMDGIAIGMEGFGASAPAKDVAKEFGFNVDAILRKLL